MNQFYIAKNIRIYIYIWNNSLNRKNKDKVYDLLHLLQKQINNNKK